MTTAAPTDTSKWTKARRELGLRLARRLFDELAKSPMTLESKKRPGASWSLIVAHVAAAAVYSVSLVSGIAGVVIVLPPWATVFDPIVGVMLLLLAWAARPQAAAPPDYWLDRAEFPTLYAAADRIAKRSEPNRFKRSRGPLSSTPTAGSLVGLGGRLWSWVHR